MKRILIALAASAIMALSAMADTTIGVSMAFFDDLFLTNVREAMAARAKELGVKIQFEDAQGDIGRQLSQIQNFTAQKVGAIIVNPVASSATPQMTKLATDAGIPLVFVNRPPSEKELPKGVAFVGSDENVPGKLQAEELARMLNKKGNIAILMGELGTGPAEPRTEGAVKVIAQNPDMKIVAKQSGNWKRNEAMDVMNNWLISGEKIDAVISNNDEMAIGAIMALQAAGSDPKKTLVAGIDATRDGLGEMQRGNLAMTVFQDAKGQGKVSVDVAAKLAKGEQVDSFNWIPFEPVTQENFKGYLNK